MRTLAGLRTPRAAGLAPAGVIVGGLVVLGVLQGVVWSQVAPGQQAKVYNDGSYGSLPTADYHPFTDLAIFVLAGLAVGLVAAAAVWRVRAIRGSVTIAALALGAAAGAAVAYGVGLALVSGVDPASVGATGHESIVVAAPKLVTPLVLVAEPLAAVAVYTFLVAWDGRPDLGRLRLGEQDSGKRASGEPGSRESGSRESGTRKPAVGPGSGESGSREPAAGPGAQAPTGGSPATQGTGVVSSEPDADGDGDTAQR